MLNIIAVLMLSFLADTTLLISWDPVRVDINGDPEVVVAYETKIYNNTTGELVSSNTDSSTEWSVTSNSFAAGEWKIEVRAIDASGNKSDPAVLVYINAADLVPPAVPESLKVLKKSDT